MTNVQAALGVAQMEYIEEYIERKNRNYTIYKELLGNNENFELLDVCMNVKSNRWFYALCIKKDVDVKAVVNLLNQKNIQTRTIWGLIHLQKPYRKNIAFDIKKATYYSEHIINLPCSTNITGEEIKEVCVAIKEIFEQSRC